MTEIPTIRDVVLAIREIAAPIAADHGVGVALAMNPGKHTAPRRAQREIIRAAYAAGFTVPELAYVFDREARHIIGLIERRSTDAIVATIVTEVSQATGIAADAITGKGRGCREAAYARQEVMRRARAAGMSLPRIGRALDRDPSTIIHGVRAAEARQKEASQ